MSAQKQTIHLDGEQVIYTLKESRRAMNIRMSISYEQGLVVAAPSLVPRFMIERFLRAKSAWILKHLAKMQVLEEKKILKGGRREYLKYKAQARVLVALGVSYFNQFYKFSYKRISIRNQKTLWGSCSRNGNLQFNYKLVHLPKSLSDYIIVHELCHLVEHNHSARFWAQVAKTIPNHKEIRKQLHQYMLTTS